MLHYAREMLGRTPAAASSPYGSHEYWIIDVTSNNGHASLTGLTNLRFYDQSGTLIPTTGGSAIATGTGADPGTVGNLFDGTGTDYLASATGTTQFGYHFAAPVAVASIEMDSDIGDRKAAIATAALKYSDNGSAYTTAFNIWEISWISSTLLTRAWPQTPAAGEYKAHRFYVTAANGGAFAIMGEAELHATNGGADITTTPSTSYGSPASTQEKLWDNNANDGAWLTVSSEVPGWFMYVHAVPKHVSEYTLTNDVGTQYSWNAWKLQGTNDGVTFTDLDTQSGITWASEPLTKTFNGF